jgi:serine/threonine-protein kinase
MMNGVTESGLLRLAIAKGVLHWEDLNSISQHLREGDGSPARTPLSGRYVQALIAAGYLTPEAAAELADELEHAAQDSTPNLLGTRRPPRPGAGSARSVAPEGSGDREDPLPLDLRFLVGWSRYRIERFVGAGGMGTVYKAWDPNLNRFVALKFLHRNDPLQTARFLREARAQARVEHPNVCQVYEVGEVEGRPYIAMQYLEGAALSTRRETLSLEDKVRAVRDVARAIHAAHRTGLIHRDLKPGNVLVTRGEGGEVHPYVLDFGLALETDESGMSTSAVLGGTPAYLSPEAARGEPVDPRSDVYSLGVMLYELVSGARPYAGLNLANALVRIANEEPVALRKVNPALPQDLETIVHKCLEKDRVQRYASARDLAEDLDRFLYGDPIQARPASWGYRLRKRLRKNRLLALVSLAAAAALVALGTANLHARWQAREQAELAQRFGERIGRLEADMRLEAYLPLHPVTARKRELGRDLDAIVSEMKSLGKIAEGPGHEALGKGYLALHLYEPAFAHLESAWRTGQRNADVAAALAEAGGVLYEHSLTDLTPSAEGKAAARAEVERAFRAETLAVLREALAQEAAPPSYLAALLAFYEKRYADALEAARRAWGEDPRLYKAAQLEARVYAAQADAAADGGRYAEALALYDRSGEVYGRILKIAPSDAALYAGDCSRRARRLEAVLATGEMPERELADAVAACDLALAVDPEISDALNQKASMYWRRGDERRKRGEDPAPDLAQAIDLAQRASLVAPRDAHAVSSLSLSYRLLAQWQLDHGVDPRPAIAQGTSAARRAVALQPGYAAAYNALGTALLVQVQVEQQRGGDPRPALAEAIASCERATALNAKYLPGHINLGNAWKAMAEAEAARGQDPAAAVAKSAAAFERAIALNPNRAATYNNLGNTYLTLGEHQAARGTDPRPALERAAASYRRSTKLKPDYSLAHYNLGYTERSLAAALLERRADPRPALDAAMAALERAGTLNPTDADTFLEKARAHLVAGRREQSQKGNGEVPFRAAEADLARAEALNPKQSEIFFTAAEIARFRAEANPKDAGAVAEKGLVRIEKAIAINAGEARYLALRGILQTLAAENRKPGPQRSALAQHALASFDEAVHRNPTLASDYAPWRERARKAGDGGVAATSVPVTDKGASRQ